MSQISRISGSLAANFPSALRTIASPSTDRTVYSCSLPDTRRYSSSDRLYSAPASTSRRFHDPAHQASHCIAAQGTSPECDHNRELAIVRRAFRLGAKCDPPEGRPHFRSVQLLKESNVRTGFPGTSAVSLYETSCSGTSRPLFVTAHHVGATRRINLGPVATGRFSIPIKFASRNGNKMRKPARCRFIATCASG